MVAITDLWKAANSPTPLRPDKWFKSDYIQEKLENVALIVSSGVQRDEKSKIVCIPGILDVVRGGRYTQGTYLAYDLAMEYTNLLSKEVHEWFTDILLPVPETEEVIQSLGSSSFLTFPIGSDDFPGQVRVTPDGRVSVYDSIGYTTGNKNPHDIWKRMAEPYPEVLAKCENFQFPGKGQRETPVATLEVFLEILVLLPGRVAAMVRERAVRTLVRAMRGDLTLVEEILDRIQDSSGLVDLEKLVRLRRERAYSNGIPGGLLSNPLKEGDITPEIRNGYGWKKKTPEMINLLVNLSTYISGMLAERDSPHRSYGESTSKTKNRIIPLSIRTLENTSILHVYDFVNSYVDDQDVVEIFKARAYPEIAYRDNKSKGVKSVVAHLVSPGGITQSGAERLAECQLDLDEKYGGFIKLDSMTLDELVWGEMYPAIEEKYRDDSGKLVSHQLNRKIKAICKKLCPGFSSLKTILPNKEFSSKQLNFLDELMASP